MNVRNFALVLGVIYLIVGVLGFIPGPLRDPPANAADLTVATSYGYLFGLFPVNVLHNLFHIVIGIWGVSAARFPNGPRKFAKSIAIIYGVLTVFGLLPGLNTLFGLLPLNGHDVWLHAVTAIVAAYFGFRSTAREEFSEHGAVMK
jgi:hypothetical protein